MSILLKIVAATVYAVGGFIYIVVCEKVLRVLVDKIVRT